MISSSLAGLPGGSKGFFLANFCLREKKSIVVITQEDLEAEGLSADVEAWIALQPAEARLPAIYLPELDDAMRIHAMGRWATEKRSILLCSKAALEKPVYSPQQL